MFAQCTDLTQRERDPIVHLFKKLVQVCAGNIRAGEHFINPYSRCFYNTRVNENTTESRSRGAEMN